MGKWLSIMGLYILPLVVWGQSATTMTPLIMDCTPAALPITTTDPARQQVVLDSISSLLVGRWKLVRQESGWSAPQKPTWWQELLIDRQGQCVVRMEGNWISSFRLALRMQRGQVLFASSEHKGAPFLGFTSPDPRASARKQPRLGRITLCGPYLLMSDNRADGQGYTYERVNATGPDNTSLTPVACRDSLLLISQVNRVKGQVQYNLALRAYVMEYLPDAGSMSPRIGILCNWPQASEYVGKTITFSGKYYAEPGGHQRPIKQEGSYYLRITGFHPVE